MGHEFLLGGIEGALKRIIDATDETRSFTDVVLEVFVIGYSVGIVLLKVSK